MTDPRIEAAALALYQRAAVGSQAPAEIVAAHRPGYLASAEVALAAADAVDPLRAGPVKGQDEAAHDGYCEGGDCACLERAALEVTSAIGSEILNGPGEWIGDGKQLAELAHRVRDRVTPLIAARVRAEAVADERRRIAGQVQQFFLNYRGVDPAGRDRRGAASPRGPRR